MDYRMAFLGLGAAITALVLSFAPTGPAAATVVDPKAPALQDEETFPPKLSQTGVFESLKDHRLHKSFVPFSVNASYWADGAEKIRAIKVPEGSAIKFKADGQWYFPVGTVMVKSFYLKEGEKTLRIETRLIRRAKFGWLFSTYLWNDDQTDADLQLDDMRFPAVLGHNSQMWGTPHQLDCMECHNEKAGRILGFKLRQLNLVEKTKEGGRNQLERLAAAGVLKGLPESLEALPRHVSPSDEKADLDDRARTYLDVNCATCHRPETPITERFNLKMDMRREKPIFETGLIQIDPRDPKGERLLPRSPRRAFFLRRIAGLGDLRMPPIGSLVIDEEAHRMLYRWFSRFYR